MPRGWKPTGGQRGVKKKKPKRTFGGRHADHRKHSSGRLYNGNAHGPDPAAVVPVVAGAAVAAAAAAPAAAAPSAAAAAATLTSESELEEDVALTSSDSDSEEQPPETAPRQRPKPRPRAVPSIVKGARGASRAAKRIDGGKARQTVSRRAEGERARKLRDAARLIYGLEAGDALPQQAIHGLERHKLLPKGTSEGKSLIEVLAVEHALRPSQSRRHKVKRIVAAATGQTKEKYAPRGSGGSVTSSPVKRKEQRRLDGVHNPTPNFFLPGGCGHTGCTEQQCGYGVRCDPQDILQRYAKLHAKQEWWHPSIDASERCVFVRQCDDGMDAKRRKSTWSLQTSSFSVMNEPKCASVAHTLVHCIAQCKETKSEMGPVLQSTASAMAGLNSLDCQGMAVPVAQFIGQDLKAQGIQDRVTLSKIAGQFCEFCMCDHEFRMKWPEDLASMRAGPEKTKVSEAVDCPRSVEYAVAAAPRVAAFADTATMYYAVIAHCSVEPAQSAASASKPKPRFERSRLIVALRSRQIAPKGSKAGEIEQLVSALRQEGPAAAAAPAPQWERRQEPWVKMEDKDPVYEACVSFARNNHDDITAILACHSGSTQHTHGHLGPPCSPHIPWEHRCAGVFHTSLHHRNKLFVLFSELAHACGNDCLLTFATALVKIGLDDIGTEAMQALDVPGRQPSTRDAFDGPDSIVFMFMMPRLLATVFDLNNPEQNRCAEQLGKGRKLIRDVHRLMLCLDWEALGIDDGPAQLRTASYKLCKWLREVTDTNTHGAARKDIGLAHFNSAFHNLRHICDLAELLWEKGRIPIGRFSEQGNEALNASLLYEMREHCNNNRTPDLKKNMFVLALQNIWRDNFQYLTEPLRKKMTCKACVRCAAGQGCGRPQGDCKDPGKTPVRLDHAKECSKCPCSAKYNAQPKYDDIVTALDKCVPIY